MNPRILQLASGFAARWGFLTQEIFFEFFCNKSRAQKYRYWSFLVERGNFFPSKTNTQVLLLTKKGRTPFREMARPARLSMYVDHDALVARVFLALQPRDLIVRSWLEDELIRNPMETYAILGTNSVHRVPDLVFDLKSAGGGFVRCALEIERTVKSQGRYAKMALAYLGYAKIDVIIFGCGGAATEAAVRRAFSGGAFVDKKRIPGIFNFTEFDPTSLQTVIRFNDREFSFQNFIEIVTKLPVQKLKSLRDRNEIGVSLRNPSIGEAA